MKDKILSIRVSSKEKEELEILAKKEGHNSVSGFLMWLLRQYKGGSLKKTDYERHVEELLKRR